MKWKRHIYSLRLAVESSERLSIWLQKDVQWAASCRHACSLTFELFEICSRFMCFLSDNAILALVSLKLKNYFSKYYHEYTITCILAFLFSFLSITYNTLHTIGISRGQFIAFISNGYLLFSFDNFSYTIYYPFT